MKVKFHVNKFTTVTIGLIFTHFLMILSLNREFERATVRVFNVLVQKRFRSIIPSSFQSNKCLRQNRNYLKRFASPGLYHEVGGFVCVEVEVKIEKRGIGALYILEAGSDAQEALINLALEDSSIDAEEDPYGTVLWPAAKTCAMRLLDMDLRNLTVLELGTGTGLVALSALYGGAKAVIATDYNMLTLKLLEKALNLQETPPPLGVLSTQFFDVKDFSIPLPEADIVVIADLLYDKKLAYAVGKRICEAHQRNYHIIVGNSPGRPGTSEMLKVCNEGLGFEVAFKNVVGHTVAGYRNPLISVSSTSVPVEINTSILEISNVR